MNRPEEQLAFDKAAANHAKAMLDAEVDMLVLEIGSARTAMTLMVHAAALARRHGHGREDVERWAGYALRMFDRLGGPP